MQLTVFRPSARLAPFVRRFAVIETREEVTRALIPEASLAMGLRYSGGSSLVEGAQVRPVSDASITGILSTIRRMRTHAGGGIVVTMFRETGAARFFRLPMHELFGETVGLDALVPRAELERVRSRLCDAADHAQRIAIVEEFLAARLAPEPVDPIVDAAARAIAAARGSLRISELARSLGISQDPLEKRFRRVVGAAPKQLASLLRLGHAITAYRAGASLSRVALEAGYFDQSHFNREFRAVTGEAPTQFFRDGASC
jgi:AraC-like DNA-binding protein